MTPRIPSDELEVEIVHARLADFPDLSRFDALLADDEKERATGYKFEESRHVFTLARGLLRLELAKRLGMDPRDVHFVVRPSGKPDLRPGTESRPDWRFSVSHTGPHLALAFALGADVGIDIERLDREVKPLEIAKRYFTAREFDALLASPEEARTPAFFAVWTRKEAMVKARGHTMAESLTTLSVDLDPSATNPGYEDTVARPVCRLAAFSLPGHGLTGAVAVCSERAPRLRFDHPSAPRFD